MQKFCISLNVSYNFQVISLQVVENTRTGIRKSTFLCTTNYYLLRKREIGFIEGKFLETYFIFLELSLKALPSSGPHKLRNCCLFSNDFFAPNIVMQPLLTGIRAYFRSTQGHRGDANRVNFPSHLKSQSSYRFMHRSCNNDFSLVGTFSNIFFNWEINDENKMGCRTEFC